MWTPLQPLTQVVGRLFLAVDDSRDVWDPLYEDDGDDRWPGPTAA